MDIKDLKQRAEYVLEVTGVDAAPAQFERASAAVIKFSSAAELSAKQVDLQEKSLTRVSSKLTSIANKEMTDYERAQRRAIDVSKLFNAAIKDGIQLSSHQLSGIDRVISKYDELSASIGAAKDGAAGAAGSVARIGPALDRWQKINLARQFQDVGVSLAGGQDIGLIALQQGSQIYDALASGKSSVAAGAKEMGTSILRFALNPVTLLTAALGTAGYAAMRFADQQAALDRALNGIGRQSGTTTAELRSMASAASGSGALSYGDAVSAAAQYAGAGIGRENIATLLSDTKQFSRAFGVDMDAAQKEIAQIVGEGGLGSFEKRFGSVSFATKEMVRSLEATGRYSEAAALKTRLLDNETKKAKDSATALEKAWEWVKSLPGKMVAPAGAALDRLANGPSLEEQLQKAKDDAARLHILAGDPSLSPFERMRQSGKQSLYPGEEAANKRVSDIQKQIDDRDAIAARERRNLELNRLSQSASATIDSLFPDRTQLRSLTESRDVLQKLLGSDDGLAKLGDRADDARAAVAKLGNAIELIRSPLERVTEANMLALRSAEAETVGQRAQIAAEQAFRAEMETSKDRLAAVTAAEGARNVVLQESARAMREQAKQAERRADLAGLGPYERAAKEAWFRLQDNLKKADEKPGAGADMSIYDRSVVVPFDRASSAATRLADAMTGAAARIEGAAGKVTAAAGGSNVVPLFARSGGNFYSAIQHAEGTDKFGDPYNTSLGYMKSPKPLVDMTMAESLSWGDQVRRAQGLNSSAKGAFQITNTTQRDAMRALGLGMNDNFSAENQNRMADWIFKTQGAGAWEGFKSHPADAAVAKSTFGDQSAQINKSSEAWREYNAEMRELKVTQVDNWLRDENRSLDEQRKAIDLSSGAWGTNKGAIAAAEEKQRLLNEAQRLGIDVSKAYGDSTETLSDRLDKLAKKAADTANAQEEQRKRIASYDLVRSSVNDVGSSAAIAAFRGQDVGSAAKEALMRAGENMLQQTIGNLTSGLLGSMGSDSLGPLGDLLGIGSGNSKSTANMNVKASVVNIAGGIGGSTGGLLSGLGGIFGSNDNFAGQAAGAVGPFQQSSGFFDSIFSGIGSLFGFAEGGVMTGHGALPMRRYAGGGIANSPQLAMFGEGRVPEAYIPMTDPRGLHVVVGADGGAHVALPGGRGIPAVLSAAGAGRGVSAFADGGVMTSAGKRSLSLATPTTPVVTAPRSQSGSGNSLNVKIINNASGDTKATAKLKGDELFITVDKMINDKLDSYDNGLLAKIEDMQRRA